MLTRRLTLGALSALCLGFGGPAAAQELDIVETANAANNFTVLVRALIDTELFNELKAEGPFTVFAPTDAAFEALPEGTLESLSPEELKEVLLYHVIPGAPPLAAEQLAGKVQTALTLQGDGLRIDATGDTPILNDKANVFQTDIQASNGVIHVIDQVVLPPQ